MTAQALLVLLKELASIFVCYSIFMNLMCDIAAKGISKIFLKQAYNIAKQQLKFILERPFKKVGR